MSKRIFLGLFILATLWAWGQDRPTQTPQEFGFNNGDPLFREQLGDSCLVLLVQNGFHGYVSCPNATVYKQYSLQDTTSIYKLPFSYTDTIVEQKTNEDGTLDYDTIYPKAYYQVDGEKLNDIVPVILVAKGNFLYVYKAQSIEEAKEKKGGGSGFWNVLKWIGRGIVVFLALLYVVCVAIPKIRKAIKKWKAEHEKKRFKMDFSLFADADETIAKLQKKAAETKSMKFKSEGKSISFEFSKKHLEKVKPFVDELKNYLLGDGGVLTNVRAPGSEFDRACKSVEDEMAALNSFLEVVDQTSDGAGSDGGQSDNTTHDDSRYKADIDQLKGEIEDLKKYKTALNKVAGKARGVNLERESKFDEGVDRLQKAVENWEDLVSRRSDFKSASDVLSKLDEWVSKTGKKTPDAASEYIRTLKEVETEFLEFKKKLKNAPDSFKGNTDFEKLSKLIEKAQAADSLQDELGKHPESFGATTETGKLVAKGRLLDEIKENAMLVLSKNELKDTDLGKMVGFVEKPESILDCANQRDAGLYKLIKSIDDIEKESAKGNNDIAESVVSYDWLKPKTGTVIKSHNQFLLIKRCASDFGNRKMETKGMAEDVKQVFTSADAYLDFISYKNYWKNIKGVLFSTLNTLPDDKDNNQVHNIRALIFYTSQFYSMSCIMNEIYGDNIQPTRRAKLNVEIFKGENKPALTSFGFPELESSVLDSCRFEYKGGPDEGKMLEYLKKYKPLKFIFIQSYYHFDE